MSSPGEEARDVISIVSHRGDGHIVERARELNRLCSWLGAMAQSNMDDGPEDAPIESALKTAAHLGQRVAEIAPDSTSDSLWHSRNLEVTN